MATSLRTAARPLLQCTRTKTPSAIASTNKTTSIRFNSTSSSSHSDPLPMPWSDYFTLRHRRRVFSSTATFVATPAALMGAAAFFGNLEADPTQPIFGIEPVYVYAGSTMGLTALGFLVAPTIGSLLFKLSHRSKINAMEIMDKRIYERIVKNRGDPSYQSVNNIQPDYYGEKIRSLHGYRRWLRDQGAYKKKALHGVDVVEA